MVGDMVFYNQLETMIQIPEVQVAERLGTSSSALRGFELRERNPQKGMW